jgi:two-component system, cell cycle sensor histidine kinase PleC
MPLSPVQGGATAVTAVVPEGADAFLAQVLNSIPNPVFVKDEAHRIVFFNDAFCAALGGTREELQGKSDFDLVPAEEARVYWEKDDAVFRTGQPTENEEALTDANGVRHWLLTRKSIMKLPGGGRYLVGVISDITERKRAEERLADSIEALSEGFVLFDAQDRLVLCNRRYKQLYAESADLYVPGARFEDLVRSALARSQHPKALGREDAWLAARVAAHRAAQGSFEQELPGGRWVRVVERRTSDGGTVGIRIDISESKRREAELRRAKEEAETANRTKTEFLANMSHELRTPLNAIIGFSEVLRLGVAGDLSPKQAEYVRDIHNSGLHLLDLINDVLDISRIDVGEIALRDAPVRLGETAEACRQLLHGRAVQGGVELEIACPDDIPLVRGDPVRLKQILLNLLSNAIKFTPAGGRVTLTASHAADVTITVADTGIGMAPEDIPIALEPFRQLDGSLSRRQEGAGLGLPLAKRLAELHGGSLEITSTPGRGTQVVVRLPAHRILASEDCRSHAPR